MTLIKTMIDPLVLSQGDQPFIFLHANGYPPQAYQSFLTQFLGSFQVEAFYQRPFWPGSNPSTCRDWIIFRDDYLGYLEGRFGPAPAFPNNPAFQGIIGVGHSLGAMASLMAAIIEPAYFRCLVVIEPVLFSALRGSILSLLSPLGLVPRVLPLIGQTLNRKRSFSSRESMFENYRSKSVFEKFSDQVLMDYVQGLAEDTENGRIVLRYSPDWEARIYETAGVADKFVWKNLDKIDFPVLVIRGAESDTFQASALDRLVKELPRGKAFTMKGAGHLVPLEYPREVSNLIVDFIQTAI